LKVYERLRAATGKGIEGRYLYCGRKALTVAEYKGNPVDFLQEQFKKRELSHFEWIFKALGLRQFYKDKQGSLKESITDISALGTFLDRRQKNAQNYFCNHLKDEERTVVYDTGYNGSISEDISLLTGGKKIDKIYLWATSKDTQRNLENGTHTIVLSGTRSDNISAYVFIIEECFSSLEKSVLEYDGDKPVFDNSDVISGTTKKCLAELHKGIFDYTNTFINYFGPLISSICDVNGKYIIDYMRNIFLNWEDHSIGLFKDICFEDYLMKYSSDGSDSLFEKILVCFPNTTEAKRKMRKISTLGLLQTVKLHIKRINEHI
jgi:hypothetical protein